MIDFPKIDYCYRKMQIFLTNRRSALADLSFKCSARLTIFDKIAV